MTPFNPDSWMDLLAYVILGVPATIAAVAAWRGRQAVTNGHKTHVRDDIDEIKQAVEEGFRQVGKDIGGLREELRTERVERIEGDRLRIVRGGMQ